MLPQTSSTLPAPALGSARLALRGRVDAPRVLRGRNAILAAQPLLARLARRTGQTGEADSLAYFLSTPDAIRKTPWLLLFESAGAPTEAVFLFEYRAGLFGTRVFATADGSGRRGVLALPERRAHTAALAARLLLQRGAHIVHIAFSETHTDAVTAGLALPPPATAEPAIATHLRSALPGSRARWALLEREIPAFLPLCPTFDATLARIGRRTRINLRYYRRRAEHDLGCSFIPQARISLAGFLAFNRECTYAVSDALATFRFQALSDHPNQCLRGIRDRDGRWLALVGTRRQNRFVEIDWQMNRAGLPAASLATVLRSYLIEHEIALGSTRLYMEGGTPQPILRSFLPERIAELTLRRDSLYVRLLQRFAAKAFPKKNYIGQILTDPTLLWNPLQPSQTK